MSDSNTRATAPGKTVSYVLGAGDGRCFNVAGQLIRVLAEGADTAGGFGAVVCEATYDRQPIPMHFHEKEHDTWFCTRGRLRVWFGNSSRLLTEGDFAYVPSHEAHSYQSVAPRTQFFGIVAPGGWEKFFEESGESWAQPGLPPGGHPFDFSRMGRSMGKYRVMRVEGATYADAVNGDETDRALPAQVSSFVLQAGYGARARLNGHLSTGVLSREISAGHLDMRTIEAGRDTRMPVVRHLHTHVFHYAIDGAVRLVLDGQDTLVTAGACANIPAGTAYSTRVESGAARWLLTAAHGDGLSFWDDLGTSTPEFTFLNEHNLDACRAAIRASDRDVTLAE